VGGGGVLGFLARREDSFDALPFSFSSYFNLAL
jgi:hypothetical protein